MKRKLNRESSTPTIAPPRWMWCPHTRMRFQELGRVAYGVDVRDEFGNRRVVNAMLWDGEMIPCRPPKE